MGYEGSFAGAEPAGAQPTEGFKADEASDHVEDGPAKDVTELLHSERHRTDGKRDGGQHVGK